MRLKPQGVLELDVAHEAVVPRAPVATLAARKWLHARVRDHVAPHVSAVPEAFAAFGTHKRRRFWRDWRENCGV